jgi:hypothetical protein
MTRGWESCVGLQSSSCNILKILSLLLELVTSTTVLESSFRRMQLKRMTATYTTEVSGTEDVVGARCCIFGRFGPAEG